LILELQKLERFGFDNSSLKICMTNEKSIFNWDRLKNSIEIYNGNDKKSNDLEYDRDFIFLNKYIENVFKFEKNKSCDLSSSLPSRIIPVIFDKRRIEEYMWEEDYLSAVGSKINNSLQNYIGCLISWKNMLLKIQTKYNTIISSNFTTDPEHLKEQKKKLTQKIKLMEIDIKNFVEMSNIRKNCLEIVPPQNKIYRFDISCREFRIDNNNFNLIQKDFPTYVEIILKERMFPRENGLKNINLQWFGYYSNSDFFDQVLFQKQRKLQELNVDLFTVESAIMDGVLIIDKKRLLNNVNQKLIKYDIERKDCSNYCDQFKVIDNLGIVLGIAVVDFCKRISELEEEINKELQKIKDFFILDESKDDLEIQFEEFVDGLIENKIIESNDEL